ncbi:MAG: RluA family pseudouridine synthase [Nannocystaceae bacterium]|nr:RluA family pseudouridine synthase [Nannocystaceae bacterium]
MEPDAQVVEHVVEESQADMRVDAILVAMLPWRSRGELASFVTRRAVTVNDKVCKKARRVKTGDVVRIILPKTREDLAAVRALPLDVVFEDEDLVVVNKPSGLAVHPSAGVQTLNLLRRLQLHYEEEAPDSSVCPSVVHRLDRSTSGVIVYARRRELVAFYTGQFEARTTSKTYVARVHGVVPETGEWTWPLRVDDATNVVVDRHGKPSRTTFERMETDGETSLVRVRPITGRKHQIRIHFAHGGHPLCYDDLYGIDGQPEVWAAGARLGLHAHVLELDHRNGERLRFEASIPEALRA